MAKRVSQRKMAQEKKPNARHINGQAAPEVPIPEKPEKVPHIICYFRRGDAQVCDLVDVNNDFTIAHGLRRGERDITLYCAAYRRRLHKRFSRLKRKERRRHDAKKTTR